MIGWCVCWENSASIQKIKGSRFAGFAVKNRKIPQQRYLVCLIAWHFQVLGVSTWGGSRRAIPLNNVLFLDSPFHRSSQAFETVEDTVLDAGLVVLQSIGFPSRSNLEDEPRSVTNINTCSFCCEIKSCKLVNIPSYITEYGVRVCGGTESYGVASVQITVCKTFDFSCINLNKIGQKWIWKTGKKNTFWLKPAPAAEWLGPRPKAAWPHQLEVPFVL